MSSFTSNSTGYAINVDSHLKGERWYLSRVRLQVHMYLVYEMEIPASTAAAANKLTTALNKQLLSLKQFANFKQESKQRISDMSIMCNPAMQAYIPLNIPFG